MPPAKIMLVRHAEKEVVPPPFGIDAAGEKDKHSLDVRGWQRAGALVPFFRTPQKDGIATPSALYAAAVSDQDRFVDGENVAKSLRPQETLAPLALALGCAIVVDWSVGQEAQLVNALRAESGVVLVAWEHKHIPAIAGAFTGNAPASWPGDRFDVVWVLDALGAGYAFRETSQGLLGGDAP